MAQNCARADTIHAQKCPNTLIKCFGGPTFQGCIFIRKCKRFYMDTTTVYSVLTLFTVLNFHFMKNQFSPPGSLHWHCQHCELAPAVKEHISWYNDVENHSSFANQITSAVVGQHPTSQPPDRAATSTETLSGGEGRKGATSESPKFLIMWLFSSQYLAISTIWVDTRL